jgi:hypothetical protein
VSSDQEFADLGPFGKLRGVFVAFVVFVGVVGFVGF